MIINKDIDIEIDEYDVIQFLKDSSQRDIQRILEKAGIIEEAPLVVKTLDEELRAKDALESVGIAWQP
jgi:hypothetical protein